MIIIASRPATEGAGTPILQQHVWMRQYMITSLSYRPRRTGRRRESVGVQCRRPRRDGQADRDRQTGAVPPPASRRRQVLLQESFTASFVWLNRTHRSQDPAAAQDSMSASSTVYAAKCFRKSSSAVRFIPSRPAAFSWTTDHQRCLYA